MFLNWQHFAQQIARNANLRFGSEHCPLGELYAPFLFVTILVWGCKVETIGANES